MRSATPFMSRAFATGEIDESRTDDGKNEAAQELAEPAVGSGPRLCRRREGRETLAAVPPS